MSTIRIETMVDEDTLYLPQLLPFVGKPVEILVREKTMPEVLPGTSDWTQVEAALNSLEGYDADAYLDVRSAEMQSHAES